METVKWHESRVKRVKGSVSEKEFERIRSLLLDAELLNLRSVYKSRLDVIDAGTSWDVRIPHGDHQQSIQVIGFAPDDAKRLKRPYPDALVRLGCLIDKTRSDVTADRALLETECERVLEAR